MVLDYLRNLGLIRMWLDVERPFTQGMGSGYSCHSHSHCYHRVGAIWTADTIKKNTKHKQVEISIQKYPSKNVR